MDFSVGGIPIFLGILLLVAYHYYPERFSPKLTKKGIRVRAAVLIVGGLLLTVWDFVHKLGYL